MKITILGCGASGGVPIIGCDCAVCTSTDPKNKRTRVSLYVEEQGTRILFDTSPELRIQCVREGIRHVDAIIYTHVHADHIHGIDDVRSFNYHKNDTINAYGDAHTIAELTARFGYVFQPKSPEWGWYRPSLNPIVVEPFREFSIGPVKLLPFLQRHGKGTTLGFRIGKFAYSTDTNGLPEESLAVLEGVDTWIVDCLRYQEAPSHAHLAMSLGWIAQVKPRQAFLTHLNHDMDYATLAKEIPANVAPCYDGLVIEV